MTSYIDDFQNSCEHCSQPFYAERSTKIYCSDSCRQLAYLERRSRKMAQATYIVETDYESIPKAIQEPGKEIGDTITPIEVESLPEETNPQATRIPYSQYKRKRTSKFQTQTKKSSTPDGRLILLGAAAAGLMIYNYFKKPEATNQTNESEIKPEEQSNYPHSELKTDGTPDESDGTATLPGEKNTDFSKLSSFLSAKLPDLDKKVDTSDKSDSIP